MRLGWAHLCRYAAYDSGIWRLTGLIDVLPVGADGFVAIPEPLHLVLMFYAHANEPRQQIMRLTVRDGAGGSHHRRGNYEVNLVEYETGYLLAGPKQIIMSGWRLPGDVGDFDFQIHSGTGRLGRLPLAVGDGDVLPPVPVPAGRKPVKRPYRLVWGHISEGCSIDAKTGELSLHNIYEFTSRPPVVHGVVLAGSYLAVRLTADPTVGPDHELTVELVDPDGQRTGWIERRPLRFQPVTVGSAPIAGQVLDLSRVSLEGYGGFEFRIRVDDHPVGEVALAVHPA